MRQNLSRSCNGNELFDSRLVKPLILIDCVHKFVYNDGKRMKKRDLERQLTAIGWRLDRHGGNHDIWTNGDVYEPIPRHAEISELLAKKILKKAKNNPPPKES